MEKNIKTTEEAKNFLTKIIEDINDRGRAGTSIPYYCIQTDAKDYNSEDGTFCGYHDQVSEFLETMGDLYKTVEENKEALDDFLYKEEVLSWLDRQENVDRSTPIEKCLFPDDMSRRDYCVSEFLESLEYYKHYYHVVHKHSGFFFTKGAAQEFIENSLNLENPTVSEHVLEQNQEIYDLLHAIGITVGVPLKGA